jgi:SAM-dependent methyltransferase
MTDFTASDPARLTSLINRFRPFTSENDTGFLARVFDKGIEPYDARIRLHGLTGMGDVLDAGCGYGQWSMALARHNTRVHALDISPERLMFLDAAISDFGLSGISVHRGAAWKTGLPDASMDGVFCYGVIFLTPWRETLAEFARVLRPGGRLYVTANGLGWYKHLWRTGHNATSDYDPRMKAATVLLNTLRYERGLPLEPRCDILIEPAEMLAELDRLGFTECRQGAEGTLSGPDDLEGRPFFQGEYDGDIGIYEVMASKPA